VLEHGCAYGKNGHQLTGKKVFNVITSGGGMKAYQPEGYQHCTMSEILKPYERTASLCHMIYYPPFWIPGTHKLDISEVEEFGEKYRQLLIELGIDNINEDDLLQAISKSNAR
jgi:glutathione-regulated potassium-efflux system ancillary protein KefG